MLREVLNFEKLCEFKNFVEEMWCSEGYNLEDVRACKWDEKFQDNLTNEEIKNFNQGNYFDPISVVAFVHSIADGNVIFTGDYMEAVRTYNVDYLIQEGDMFKTLLKNWRMLQKQTTITKKDNHTFTIQKEFKLEEKCYNILTDEDFLQVYEKLIENVKNKYEVDNGDYFELICNNVVTFEGIMDEDFVVELTEDYMFIEDGTGNVYLHFNENINKLVFIKQ